MIRVSFAGAVVAAALASACATAPRSILLGAGSGVVVGGGTGYAIGQDGAGAAIGAATGALTGGILGYLLHKGSEKDAPRPVMGPEDEKYPFLTRPEVRTLWVPDTVEGNRYIEKHRVFVIEKNTSWSKDNE
jgi:hypothetical protein